MFNFLAFFMKIFFLTNCSRKVVYFLFEVLSDRITFSYDLVSWDWLKSRRDRNSKVLHLQGLFTKVEVKALVHFDGLEVELLALVHVLGHFDFHLFSFLFFFNFWFLKKITILEQY